MVGEKRLEGLEQLTERGEERGARGGGEERDKAEDGREQPEEFGLIDGCAWLLLLHNLRLRVEQRSSCGGGDDDAFCDLFSELGELVSEAGVHKALGKGLHIDDREAEVVGEEHARESRVEDGKATAVAGGEG